MRTAPLSLDEIETLGELLASTPEPAVPMEPDMLDGYLTAIALMTKPPSALPGRTASSCAPSRRPIARLHPERKADRSDSFYR